MAYVQLLSGLLLLFAGGEFLVRGAVQLAHWLRVSPLLIGTTVVAFGTSAPELAVAVSAQLRDQGEVALGSVVGSNIANLLFILGATAVVEPVLWKPRATRLDAAGLLLATLLFCALGVAGQGFTRVEGLLLLASLASMTALRIHLARREPSTLLAMGDEELPEDTQPPSALRSTFTTGLGLVGVALGANLLVVGATAIARSFAISEAVIGLTVVAIGTSLPELAACGIAAYRGHSDVALGNVIGSNVFNLLGIAGVAASMAPLELPDRILHFDLWLLCALTGCAALGFVCRGRLGRGGGGLLLVAYASWFAWGWFGSG